MTSAAQTASHNHLFPQRFLRMPSCCSVQPVRQYVNEFAAIVDAAFSSFSALINKQLEALPMKMMDTAGARVEVALLRLQNDNREFQLQLTLAMQTFQQEIINYVVESKATLLHALSMQSTSYEFVLAQEVSNEEGLVESSIPTHCSTPAPLRLNTHIHRHSLLSVFNLIPLTLLRLLETLSYHPYRNPPLPRQLRLILPPKRRKA